MHDIQATRVKWEKIPGREHLADCPHCETTESMEHVLTECNIGIGCQRQI
ncbi:hypothetical protein IW261DRAFT_1399932 [Armillaria novae-zelandiae]|uniref:Reverse transcriptase zinc-binding domain-containing protein n=1 Tax=Armillaria novae-zelandiae TaxID=153914 RepID=A0AA39P7Q1_9AGAR|nr:hypothetical protein IW261DRAFT_1399932 [Armillaria novae-zelandiae]